MFPLHDADKMTQPELQAQGVHYGQKDVLEMLRRRQTARIVEDVKYRIDAGEFDAPSPDLACDLVELKRLVDAGQYHVTGAQVAERWVNQELEVRRACALMEEGALPEYSATTSICQEVKTLLILAYLATVHVLAGLMVLEIMRRAAGG